MRYIGLALLALLGLAVPAAAQTTRADSAAVVLDAAQALERDGRVSAARELFRFIGRRYAGTPAAEAAASRLRTLPRESVLGTGRTGFVLFNTLYGAFLGVAIPAAFDASSDGAYGAGLLIGAPVGFFSSRAFAAKHIRTSGQAGIASFATVWGTWQGLGWQQVLNIGEHQDICTDFGCSSSGSDTAPWAAMVVGGLAGLGTGYALAASREVANGTSTLISQGSFWASWFGLALGRAMDLRDDDLLASTLLAGNAGLLGSLAASRSWRPSSSHVRLITAAGLAGGLAGFGIDLIANVDGAGTALGVAAATSGLGLLIGAVVTQHRSDLDQPDTEAAAGAGAVLSYRDGFRLGIALPEPAAIRLFTRDGRARVRPAARLTLFSATF